MKKLVLETTAPFQGLPELVADREGLFEKEGLQIEWVERESDDKSTHINVNTPKGLDPFSSHGKMLEQGKADMYNACEWGNYCRVQDTKVKSRQVGRRGIVTYAAIVVRPQSQVFTAQQLAGKLVCEAFYHGTEVASGRVDAETYGAFNRAVREAVKRINADKAKYLHYFIDYHAKKDADIAALKPQDLRASRIVVCDPAPIPLDEMQRTYDWLKNWGMLEQTATPLALVNLQIQQAAHTIAAE